MSRFRPLRRTFLGLLLSGPVFLFGADPVPPEASTSTVESPLPALRPFQAGESLLFVIKYGFISGGHATLQVRSTEPVHGRPAFRVVSEARTNKAMDVIFKVRDLNESWMDVEGLYSHRYHQIVQEGGYRREVESRYDHVARTFVYWHRNRKGQEHTVQGEIPPRVHDVLTSLYYLRTQPLEAGRDVTMEVNSGAKTWPLRVEVKRIQKITVPAGTFECFRVQPLMLGEGLFMQEGNLEVWLTNDERRLPVLMRSKVLVGSFRAELVSAEFGQTTFPSPGE